MRQVDTRGLGNPDYRVPSDPHTKGSDPHTKGSDPIRLRRLSVAIKGVSLLSTLIQALPRRPPAQDDCLPGQRAGKTVP